MKTTRIAALLTACAMLTGTAVMLPTMPESAIVASAASYDNFTYVNYGNYIEITGCEENAINVVIPDKIDGVSVTSIGELAFEDQKKLTAVKLPKTLKHIDRGAFYGCAGLTSIEIPEGTESIGDAAFRGCARLKNITIPESATTIGKVVFWETPWLEAKRAENPMIIINGILVDGYALKGDVVIPNTVAKIGGRAFEENTEVTSIKMVSNVKSIGYGAFSNCPNLKSVNIPKSITEIEDCTFSGCESLASIEIPDSVTSIGNSAFHYCISLTDVTIPDSVTSIGESVFMNCPRLTSVTLSDGLDYIPPSAFCYCSSLTSIEIPESVLAIDYEAFYGCSSLKNVVIPDQVYGLGYRAFADCESLTSVIIPESVTIIGYAAFQNCPMLFDVYYGGTKEKWAEIDLGDLNDSFDNADIHYSSQGPEDVKEPEDETPVGFEYLTYENYSNYIEITGCDKEATEVVIPSRIDGVPVRTIGIDAFVNCESLTSVTLPDKMSSIGEAAFHGCTALESISVPEGTFLDFMAFAGCMNLKEVLLDEGIVHIGSSCFKDCTSLETIEIPQSITGLGYNTFENCTNLKSITLPKTLTVIESDSFEGCFSLTDVYFGGTEAEWKNVVIGSGNEALLNAEIHYGSDSKPSVILGDLNGDTSINATDAALLLSAAAAAGAGGDSGLTAEQIAAADLDGNGSFDASDASYILAYAAYTGAGGEDSLDEFLESLTEPDNPIVAQLCYENKGGYIEITGSERRDITELVIPAEIDGVPVKSIANEAFQSYIDLVSVSIADGVTSIGDLAFWDCSGLTSITLPDSVETIGEAAFSNSDSLESIHVSENNKFFKSVDGVLFSKDGTALLAFPTAKTCTSYTVPDGVTTVGDYAFFSCKNMNAVIIPTTVKSVEARAFDWCVNLTDIYYTGTEEEWKEIVIANEDEEPPAPVIHYNYTPNLS